MEESTSGRYCFQKVADGGKRLADKADGWIVCGGGADGDGMWFVVLCSSWRCDRVVRCVALQIPPHPRHSESCGCIDQGFALGRDARIY